MFRSTIANSPSLLCSKIIPATKRCIIIGALAMSLLHSENRLQFDCLCDNFARFGRAGVAQLVEHLICNQRVGGSNPSAS